VSLKLCHIDVGGIVDQLSKSSRITHVEQEPGENADEVPFHHAAAVGRQPIGVVCRWTPGSRDFGGEFSKLNVSCKRYVDMGGRGS
jgi:hypothetical protein